MTWGPLAKRVKEAENVMREALAMGADEAHLIVDEALIPGDPAITSVALAALARKLGGFDLYLTGEASMDIISFQMHGRLAELLGIPVVSFAKSLEILDGGKIRAVRSLEALLETVETVMPAVIGVTGEINQPRLPTLLQIRRAFAKPLNKYSLHDVGVEELVRNKESMGIKLLVVSRKNIIVEGEKLEEIADKLIEHLIEEGVIKL